MKTVINGKFKDGVLVKGRPAKIIAERCKNGMKEILTSKMDQKSPILTFNRNNNLRVHEPKIMDPYEKLRVYVSKTKGKGDGLFARRDIETDEIVSYYSGIIWTKDEFEEISLLSNQTGYDRYQLN